MDLDISFSGFMAALLFGAVGLWVWRQAKVRASFQLYILAVALMVYPYFTPTPFWTWGVGIVLCLVVKLVWD
jgi:hypothetical protein